MNNKKEIEREELHKTIWKIANELRGSVDGWDFKQYVLCLLFYRFISENIEYYVNQNQIKAGIEDFKYSNISDDEALLGKTQILEEKGLFILPSELFCNIRKTAKNNDNLNVTIANIFDNIESSARGTASEDDVKGLFDDFDIKGNKLGNTVEEKNEKLEKMLNAIGDLKLGDFNDNTIDAFGDAYEYLMTMYASNAGKSGGEFFTPQEVGELLAKIVIKDKKEVNKVYDPACGSGGLLLKFAKILGKDNVRQGFFGQERNLTTYNLARINMFLHNINYNNFDIAREDTLLHPCHFDNEPFDAIVSNPPYSIKWVGKDNPLLINDERFSPAGVLAPKKYSDLAFTMHMLSWLSPKGTAAIVEFPGIFDRPGDEQKIRRYLVENNFIDSIIKLPADLFYGTNISTYILVLKKNKIDNSILYIDASNEFTRFSSKNKLSEENIENIYELYKNREFVEDKAALVSVEEIRKNDYNLSSIVYFKEKIIKENKSIGIDEVEKNIIESNRIIENLHTKLENAMIDINNSIKVENIIKKKVSEISTFRRGSFPQPYADSRWYGGKDAMPFVQVADVGNDMKLVDVTKHTISKIAQPKSVFVPKGSVIMTIQGSIGKAAITQYDCYVDRTIAIFDNIPDNINKKYFIYQLQKKFNEEKLFARGSTIKTVTIKEFKEFKIPIPSIDIQEKIVKKLDDFNSIQNDLQEELLKLLESRKIEQLLYSNQLLSLKEN